MTRALIITNPAAARTRPESVETVIRVLRGGGWEVNVLATGGPGESGESNAWPGVEQQVAADVEDGSDPATDGLTEDFGDEDGDEVDGAREDRPRLEPVF